MSVTPQTGAHGRSVHFQRAKGEIADFEKNPRSYVKEVTKAHKFKDVYQFKVQGMGLWYENLVFVVLLDISLEYPFKPPILRFVNTMYHPNVDPKTGELCSSLLLQENWKPETRMEDVLLNMLVLISEPDLSRPVNLEAAQDYIEHKGAFGEKVMKLAKGWKT